MAKQNSKLKYNLQQVMENRPARIKSNDLIAILGKHGISRNTWYRDLKVKSDDAFSIPTERLEVYAGVFGVDVESLKNYKPKDIKSIYEGRPIKTGLGK